MKHKGLSNCEARTYWLGANKSEKYIQERQACVGTKRLCACNQQKAARSNLHKESVHAGTGCTACMQAAFVNQPGLSTHLLLSWYSGGVG